MADCVFCGIVEGALPSQKEYEDEEIMAFRSIDPKDDVHIIFVPKAHIPNLGSAEAEQASVFGRMLLAMKDTATKLKIDTGYRIVINNGHFQEVPHVHFHLLGGSKKGGI